MSAEGEANRLRQGNNFLRADNERLQRLLSQANDIIQKLDAKMVRCVSEGSKT